MKSSRSLTRKLAALLPALLLTGILAQAQPAPTPPTIAKAFPVVSFKLGTTTSLQFTITNPNATLNLTNVAFSDILPAGLQLVSVDFNFGCGAATITPVTTLPSSLTVSGATVGAVNFIGGNQCVIGTTVRGVAGGLQHNVTSTVTSTEADPGAATSADVNVVIPPTIAKGFNAPFVYYGNTTPLQITVTNPNSVPLTNVNFTDALPAGLTFVSLDYNFGCGAGAINTTPTSVSLVNGNIFELGSPNGNTCVIGFTVRATDFGLQTNVTSTVTSTEADPSATATAAIEVISTDVFQLRYFGNLDKGDSYVNLTNAGTLQGFDPAGRICVNVYTFDPAEELISCCACPVTPNGLNTLSARNDLISNTLTPGVPTAIVVKLLATIPGPGGVCNPSTPTPLNQVRGMRAWGTTLHLNTSGSPAVGYQETETPFTRAELSPSELTKLTSYCGFVQANGSGFGICRSCRAGALGAEQK